MKKTIVAVLLVVISIMCLTSCGISEKDITNAVDERDAKELTSLIQEYTEKNSSNEELNEALTSEFERLCSRKIYEDFVFADKVLKGIEDTPIYDDLAQIVEANAENRIKSYIVGKWVRADGTGLDGCVLDVKWTGENGVGVITSTIKTLNNTSKFAVNDIKWYEIEAIDDRSFKLRELSKGDYGGSYSQAIAKINYDGNYIECQSADSSLVDDYSMGYQQVWVKKAYLDSFNGKNVLKKEDFLVTGDNVTNKNILKDISDGSINWYYYDSKADKTREGVITTNREIHLGSSKKEVLNKYGMGSLMKFNRRTELFYNLLIQQTPQEGFGFAKQLKENCSYIMQYFQKNKKKANIRFYFDKNDEVMGIVYQGRYWTLSDR